MKDHRGWSMRACDLRPGTCFLRRHGPSEIYFIVSAVPADDEHEGSIRFNVLYLCGGVVDVLRWWLQRNSLQFHDRDWNLFSAPGDER